MAKMECSALVVSGDAQSSGALKGILSRIFGPVREASTITQAKQKIAEDAMDVVVINTPLPDEFGVDSALDIAEKNGNVSVILLVKADAYEQVQYKTRNSGIFVLTRPLKGQQLIEAGGVVLTARKKLRDLAQENMKLRRRMDELSLVTRAKCLLIEKKKMTEKEAHYYLEREAMDNSLSKKEVAQEIIQELGDDDG